MGDGKPRRRWRRWTVLGLFAIGLIAWVNRESSTIGRARALTIGQTTGQVTDIMGEANIRDISSGDGNLAWQFASESEVRHFRMRATVMWWLVDLGLPYKFLDYQYPVEVHARDGRVVYIRRGDERVSN
jgi:hypothetical protein